MQGLGLTELTRVGVARSQSVKRRAAGTGGGEARAKRAAAAVNGYRLNAARSG